MYEDLKLKFLSYLVSLDGPKNLTKCFPLVQFP